MFASVPKHANAETWSVDRFLAASRLRPGGVIAYHSALELQGYAYSESFDLQVIAPGQPAVLAAEGFTCRFIKAPAPFGDRNRSSTSSGSIVSRTTDDLRSPEGIVKAM